MTLTTVSEQNCFGGVQGFYEHGSAVTGTTMCFAVFRPAQSETGDVPVLTYLAGLTCTEETFTIKAGAQRLAASHGILLVAPDTSPRGAGIAGEDDDWDFGTGAGFYLDATAEPWSRHYRMYSYVTDELPALIAESFAADPGRQGIFGHSMGGHGALTIALKNPDRYRSVSAFAPISAPLECPWGQKAFLGYLGGDDAAARHYDATALLEDGARFGGTILVDQGDADPFLHRELKPERLEAACRAAGQPLDLRHHPGYDHSYYFIASFIADHMAHHAEALCG
ncbi:MAG: S-formylglutathione hydrolase [Alphaproteobacteria bacterium]